MPKNRYQRRTTLREPTFPLSNNNEPFQGAIQSSSNQSTDLGRDDARQLRENKNPNTRFIDKPDATKGKNALRDALARQEAMQRNARRQVFGERVVPQVKPQGKFTAPSVPPSPLVFKGGAVHYQPSFRGSVLNAVAGVAGELLAQPITDAIYDTAINPLIGVFTGTEPMTMEELRELDALRLKNEAEVAAMDKENERIYQQQLKDAQAPIGEAEAPRPPTLPLPTPESLTAAPKPYPNHSGSQGESTPFKSDSMEPSITHSQDIDPNREYKIRRAALGDNPTKEEIDAVVEYGLQQHRKNFPHLYVSS